MPPQEGKDTARVSWKMKGNYLKNCNCLATCPCDMTGIPAPHKSCEGMAALHIEEGHYGKVRLDGLTWAITYHWPGPLHEGNGTAQPFIDAKATKEQREALLAILSGQAGNVWFEFVASTLTKVLDPQFVPIHFEFDKARRKAKVVIPGFLETVTGPLTLPNTGSEERVIVKKPSGIEYKEMEVAQTLALKGTGPIKFSHVNTHSSLAEVTQTDKGLLA